MSASSDSTRRTLERLGSSVVPLRAPEDRERQQERLVGAINRQAARIQERRRARRYWNLGLAAAALVVGVLIVVGTILPRATSTGGQAESSGAPIASDAAVLAARITGIEGSGTVRSGDREAAALEHMPVAWGDHVLVPLGSHLRLRMPQRADVVLSERTDLSFAAAGDGSQSRLALYRGRGEFSVTPLPAGHTFAVVTPDSEVIVHGTRFAVEVRDDGETVTHVTVFEGEVGVKSGGREVVLTKGQEWTSGGHPTDRAPAAPAARNDATPAPPAKPHPSSGVTGSEPPSSTLAAETRDYMAAMAARRSGNDALALARIDAFLGRYPNSTLAHNARVERFRLLKSLGRDQEAAEEARRYMAEHPDGFARTEAKGIAIPAASATPQRR